LKVGGFTLIELLVVVAIISLLVSILLPSLSKAKTLAKAAMCLANQRGLGTAVQFYTNEYGGYLPLGYVWMPTLDPRENNWMPHLHQFISPEEEFWPDDRSQRVDGLFRCPFVDPKQHITPSFPMSYVFNNEIHIDRDLNAAANSVNTHRKIEQIQQPSEIWLITDVQWTGPFAAHTAAHTLQYWFVGRHAHDEFTNAILFVDSHAAARDDIWLLGKPFKGTDVLWDTK
jgi:prepilin-type N-terminal cleavage/methylation domain-containing protein